MRTTVKIFILTIFILAAAAAVLVFLPTIVASPEEVVVNDLHKLSIDGTIRKFSSYEAYGYNDSLYNVVVDKLALYGEEDLISADGLDAHTSALVRNYVPVFNDCCFSMFSEKVWNESDHAAMTNRISSLRKLRIEDGETPVVVGYYEDALCNVEKVIKDYNDAKKVANNTKFLNVPDANNKINEASRYRNMSPLYNCEKLCADLEMVKEKIGKSHYDYVSKMVHDLANYRRMSEDEFEAFFNNVTEDIIPAYNNNNHNYGSARKSTDKLLERAGEYYEEALEYYSQKEINIYTNSHWKSMSSPHPDYRAYYSDYNYHVPSTDADMYFTIKGYEEFTFYIRSNGESGCDYVLVQMGQWPTTNNYKASTYGRPSSYTNFNSYTPVTFSNLRKEAEYRIYVTYRKDGSVNSGDDRGYILIPRNNSNQFDQYDI